MPQFKMQGKAITCYSGFLEYFSPEDILREREFAAGFLYQHFRPLSLVDRYNSEAFYHAALNTGMYERESPLKAWDKYFKLNVIGFQIGGDKVRLKYELERQKEVYGNLILRIWNMTQETDLSENDKDRLFRMLAAGYQLARVDPDCSLISAEAAEQAYLRKPVVTTQEEKWVSFDGNGDIHLSARNEPYCILLNTELGNALLHEGNTISFRKIVAVPHPQDIANIYVTLNIYRSAQDKKPREEKFAPGDYRYVNCIKNIPVYVHPAEEEMQPRKMRRSGNQISLSSDGEELLSRTMLDGSNLIGFSVAPNFMGYLLLFESSLDDTGYAMKDTLPHRDIVQTTFRENGECLLLNRDGKVYSSLGGWQNNTRVAELSEYIREDSKNESDKQNG